MQSGVEVAYFSVAPFAGAWIEINEDVDKKISGLVAPFAGAWIEITCPVVASSTPSIVAPFAGAWIEISSFN